MKMANLGWLALAFSLAVGAQPVAVVTDATGEVLRGGQVLEILAELSAGEQVMVGDGGAVSFVYYNDGAEYQYQGPATFEVGEAAPNTLSGEEPTSGSVSPSGSGRISTVGLAQAAVVMRAGGAEPILALKYPVDSQLLERPAAFVWEPLADGVGYTFELTDGEGRSLLETTVTGSSLATPDHVEMRVGEYYSWSLESRLPDGRKFSSYASFSLADEALRELAAELKPADPADVSGLITYAIWLEQNELFAAASDYWEKASEQRPGSEALKLRARR